MRHCWLALAGMMLGTSLYAQPATQPPQAPPAAPAPGRLDTLLMRWEQEMKNVQTLVAQCARTEINQTNGFKEVFVGTARYMKPNLATLDMQKQSNPQIYEKYVCTGTFLYEYRPQNKVVRVHELPQGKPGQLPDDNFLSFLFGMKAEEARRRYDLRLVQEDQYYIYIEITPRFDADKAEFNKARMVLNNSNFLPRQLWFKQANGDEVTWDIPKLQAGAALNRNEFVAPAVPQGWNLIRVPRNSAEAPPARNDGPPRVIRPQQ